MKKITMLYVRNDSATFEKVDPELETYYELLECDCIDIVSISFNGKEYDVICDDEALVKLPPYTFSVISKEGHPMIAGNVLVCNSKDGYEEGLTPEDVLSKAHDVYCMDLAKRGNGSRAHSRLNQRRLEAFLKPSKRTAPGGRLQKILEHIPKWTVSSLLSVRPRFIRRWTDANKGTGGKIR